jgi:hypothetical protein
MQTGYTSSRLTTDIADRAALSTKFFGTSFGVNPHSWLRYLVSETTPGKRSRGKLSLSTTRSPGSPGIPPCRACH